MIKDLQRVALTSDIPGEGLQRGDIGTVVMVYDGGRGFAARVRDIFGRHIGGGHALCRERFARWAPVRLRMCGRWREGARHPVILEREGRFSPGALRGPSAKSVRRTQNIEATPLFVLGSRASMRRRGALVRG